MKKERLFYLDFVRAIAALSIIIIHFNANYLYRVPQLPEKMVFTANVVGISLGSWGVSLFFIISGAALMYTYDRKINIKRYMRKRAFSIYPMFWIAYFFAFLYLFYTTKSIPGSGVPKMNFIVTLIGFDGYLAENMQTFYILGEWFLGCIILMYVLFPLLRKMILEHPKLLVIITIIIYIMIILFYNIPFNKEKFVLTRLPEFIFGMYFIKYIKKVNIVQLIISIIILVGNTLLTPSYEVIDLCLQITYVGIASFIILVFISKYLKNKLFEKICGKLSKYSYAIFLVHHIIIYAIMGQFNLDTVSLVGSYILFILCCVIIFFLAFILDRFHDYILKELNDIMII